VAEQVVATHALWRDRYGLVPSYFLLFNEPTSGNAELIGGSTSEMVDIVKRAGQRLRAARFQTKFIVPNEETEELSLERARGILADPEARRYVGAIGYHTYPYGSAYASIRRIVDTSGAGRPDPGRIAVRRELRDLAARYGVPLWMTEVSNGGVDARSFDGVRGRAIHIHDEFVYANASAYFGMNNMWDTTTHDEHFRGRPQEGNIYSEEGTIALIDNQRGSVIITGMGYAIGHYARWVRPGSRRVEAASSDRLVQVTAFRDNSRKRLVWVVINNSPAKRIVHFRTNGVRPVGSLVGEQSTEAARWRKLKGTLPARPGFTVTVPPASVTTLERRFA